MGAETGSGHHAHMAHVLIADDEDGFRFLMRQMLTIAGHNVREVADGDAALASLRTFPAEVIITDLFMPGREGIETIMEVRRQYPKIKIIAFSGGAPKTGVSFLTLAQKLGAHKTLIKPFSADEMLAALHHLLPPTKPAAEPASPAPAPTPPAA